MIVHNQNNQKLGECKRCRTTLAFDAITPLYKIIQKNWNLQEHCAQPTSKSSQFQKKNKQVAKTAYSKHADFAQAGFKSPLAQTNQGQCPRQQDQHWRAGADLEGGAPGAHSLYLLQR